MSTIRTCILKKAAAAITTVLNTGASTLASLHNKGTVLVHRPQALLPDTKQSGLGLKILKSKIKIAALKSEIARENAFINYFTLLRHAKKY